MQVSSFSFSSWRLCAACFGLLGLVACASGSAVGSSERDRAAERSVPFPDTEVGRSHSYTAVYLAPYPQASGCETQACQLLDRMEREGYEAARTGVVSWRAFVQWYYEQRAKIYPDTDDSLEVAEMRKLQFQLAHQLDQNLITEREWVQKLEKKLASIRAPH